MNAARPLAAALASAILALAVAACGGSTPPADGAVAAPTSDAFPGDGPPGARRSISAEECTAKGGNVVGDIGDGRTHQPDFRCPSGSPPIGDVPMGVEGSVCCT